MSQCNGNVGKQIARFSIRIGMPFRCNYFPTKVLRDPVYFPFLK